MRLLITGGTGFLGKAITKRVLEITKMDVIIYSRDEYKQWVMSSDINNPRVKFILGDVRDKARLEEALIDADYCIHAAALKHVWAGEQHPYEVIQTNVIGTRNVMDVCRDYQVQAVFVSSDKAVQPTNLYGNTKMAGEALAMAAGQRVVRYGNVFGSRGSVLHKFKEWTAKGHNYKITDLRMTRFIITIDQAVDLVLETLMMPAKTLNVPDLPALRLTDLAKAFDENAVIDEIGIQPGEKLHEFLTPTQSSEDARKLTIPEIRKLINDARIAEVF
jgi:UDP-N-acetylglucosamine 4,6-dehydratase